MAERIFRIFNPRGWFDLETLTQPTLTNVRPRADAGAIEPKGDPVEKRRAQLRRAQQSYRDRRDKYTKALEAELARARKSEASLTFEVQQLRGIVGILTTHISRNGISLPSEVNSEGVSHDSVSPIDVPELTSHNNHHASGQTPNAARTPVDIQPVPAERSTDQGNDLNRGNLVLQQHGPTSFTQDPGSQATTPTVTTLSSSDKPSGKTCLSELDATIVGMEFVLTLESPCLGHLHGYPHKPDDPQGHSLTTTVQLQSSLSLPPIDPKNPVTPSYHNAPAAVLERLLTLAPSLAPEGGLTPIQAWSYVRHQPQFALFEIRSINKLAERLLDEMRCHGFGAAIQKDIFESAVREIINPVSQRLA
ncbi:bzip-type transcription factor [Trichoderma arundinaceum]|uniref:Bzip-type transcription factor n=1 Tax=Trichoderma arundinaceum TaxID=490622 RepID=A0A395NVG9_TRIAR|nr:bzip-type transcription factor [Trichoderma arundinaceum]